MSSADVIWAVEAAVDFQAKLDLQGQEQLEQRKKELDLAAKLIQAEERAMMLTSTPKVCK